MTQFRQFIELFLNRKFFKKLFAYTLLVLFIFILKDFVWIFLLTFIFWYLAYSAGCYLHAHLQSYATKYSFLKPVEKILSLNIIVFIEYIIFVGVIIFVLSDLLPKLTYELAELSRSMPFLSSYLETIQEYLELIRQWYTEIGGTFEELIISDDYFVFFDIFDRLKIAGAIFLKWLLALILSFIFIMDRDKLAEYLAGIKSSHFKFLHAEYSIIFEKVVKSFGLILRAQAMIAFVNTILTVIGLLIIGMFFDQVFPFLLTLWLVVFIFWFVPVVWVFISSIPIVFIAYSIFGISAAISVVFLILIVHMVEAYYLNPKIVSSYLELPVSLTFVILLISEHLFGLAGLLIWVSLFYFSWDYFMI